MTNDPLSRRFWVIKNMEWLMGEVIFQRENQSYYKNNKTVLWHLGDEKGEARLDEITK